MCFMTPLVAPPLYQIRTNPIKREKQDLIYPTRLFP